MRTEETTAFYLKRGEGLVREFRADVGRDVQGHEPVFVAWLERRRDEVTPATWRSYRAWLGAWADEKRKPDLAHAIRQISTSGCQRRTAKPAALRRTSARKQKCLPHRDRVALREVFRESRSKYASPVGLILEAGRIAGLRPCEWSTARLDIGPREEDLLIVENAKSTNGRSHGKFRTLHLTELRKEELTVIVAMMRLGKARQSDWPSFYKECRRYLHRVTSMLWPDRGTRPTLYSGRHQFAADAKASGFTRAEIAAMMGHGADRTASEHYGRRRHGASGFRVLPDPADVLKVRETAHSRPDFASQPDLLSPE